MGNYYLYVIGSFLTRLLPLHVAYAMAVVMADAHYLLSKTDRLAVESNLKVILGVDQVRPAMVREVFRNFGKYLTEFFTMTKYVNDDFIRAHVQIKHVEYLNDALKEGKGGIVISAHLGNWELAAAILSHMNYPMAMLALSHKDQKANEFFNAQRTFFGSLVIPTTTAIRRCLSHLKDNRLVAMLVDRDFNQHGVVMNFLNRPTMIPKGAAVFAIRTGAPIIPCFFMRQDNNDFQVTFSEPIYPPQIKEKATDEDLEQLINQYMRIIEASIRLNPTQWLMFREFWIQHENTSHHPSAQ